MKPSLFSSLRSLPRTFRAWRAFTSFREAYAALLAEPASRVPGSRRVLVMDLDDSGSVFKMLMLFVKAFQRKACEPFILLQSAESWAGRYYRLMGVQHILLLDDYLAQAAKDLRSTDVDNYLSRAVSFQALMALEFEGVKIGKYICSSLVRKTYAGSVDTQRVDVREDIRHFLAKTMTAARAARALYSAIQPDTVLFLERGYTPYGEFFDLAVAQGLNVIQVCGSHDDNAFMIKRYHPGNADVHPASLSASTWDLMKAEPTAPDKVRRVKEELFKSYASGTWFSEVGTQFHKTMMGKEDIERRLKLDPSKKTAVVFCHLFWDATFFWGVDLFNDYQEWFIETVKAACQNDRLNWILKLHPANTVKLHRDNYKGELVETRSIREHVGALPPHVKVLEPATPISTYSLFAAMDYCLTVRGTIGIESALFGVTVLTAGTGRYDGRGFTVDSSSRQDYLNKLAHLQDIPRPTAEQTALAEKYAHGTFLMRPFRFKSLSIAYRKDATATQEVKWNLRTREELDRAQDIEAFGRWAVDTRSDDYLETNGGGR